MDCDARLGCALEHEHDGGHLCQGGVDLKLRRMVEMRMIAKALRERFTADERTEWARGYNMGLKEAIATIKKILGE